MAKRKRASRGSLTPETISEAALGIADALGLENLTVRKLAEQLGVAPMSVYTDTDTIPIPIRYRYLIAFFS